MKQYMMFIYTRALSRARYVPALTAAMLFIVDKNIDLKESQPAETLSLNITDL